MSVTQTEEVVLRLGLSTGDMLHNCYFHEAIALKSVNTERLISSSNEINIHIRVITHATPDNKGETCSTQDSNMKSIQIVVGKLKKKLHFQTLY